MRKTGETIKKRYGEDYYQKLGAKGGKKKVPKGFALNKKLASQAGRKGGLKTKKDYRE